MEHIVNKENKKETIILEFVAQRSPINGKELIQRLQRKFGTRKFSEKNLYNVFSRMVKEGKLYVVDHEDLATYGLDKIDARGKYFILPEADEMRKFLDEIINSLEQTPPTNLNRKLREISLITNKYVLMPAQLDALVPILDYEIELAYKVLLILKGQIFDHNVHPRNEKELVKKLRRFLENNRGNTTHRNAIDHAIELLGYYNDNALIDQLEYDAESFDDNLLRREVYTTPNVRKVILRNFRRLYRFQEALDEEGKENIAQHISYIRTFAVDPKKYREEMKKRAEESKEDRVQ